MNIAEQIASFEAKRAELIAKMDALISKGLTLAGQDETDYQSHEAEVAEIDKHLDRLKAAEARQAASAAPVAGIKSVQVLDNTPKGADFVKYVRAVGLSNGNPMQALEIAKTMKAGDRVETVLKAAVAAGSTTDPNFAALLPAQTMAGEFIDLLRPATILGKLSQVRHVPFNMHFPKAVSGTSVSWVGEGKAAPLTNMAFADVTITEHKLSAIVPFTEELLRRSDPSVDGIIQRNLIEGISQAVDVALIDPANAGVANAKPAAITNGATTAAATGTTAAAVRADVKTAYTKFIVANHPLASGVWIMNPATALSLSMMRNANGAKEFEGINMDGGTFEGLPVVTSTNVPGDGTAGYTIVLAVQSDIFVAEGGLAIDLSREASLDMSDSPTSNSTTPTGASMVSMFQTHSVAIRAARSITWAKRRPTAVTYITAAKYA